ncbi:anti-repressor SinI [Bacillus sp. GM2]|uniref:anti-repressor SinI n=1 Tax=Bacillus TaxID=1386 RepID=UPI0003A7F1AE|nr:MULTISPECIES: anti-repressor SinI family protein [Bacillus subtilis group]MEC3835122.1 anti-repressor SinI family protein [Bacillus licheniformis]MSN97778.1 DNA-binding anti-repressor SinI [Bacillus paralicheniformis]MSO01787.1 DNA-binding anti-repressor SinI [Bacillus paralicheniformis]MSO05780.1 DNA-binding anti-repressor SinI [Bacillus paralicheniformis]MSO09773.1 DNA-binding anti-repressor SinI [Bacillus paralicheniformis]
MNKDKNEKEELDEEWIELIKHALEQGISPEDIRIFLNLGKKSSKPSASIERSHSINPF